MMGGNRGGMPDFARSYVDNQMQALRGQQGMGGGKSSGLGQGGYGGAPGFGGQQQLAQERDNYLQSNSAPAFQQMRQLQASLGGNQPTQEQQAQLENLNRQIDRDPGMRQFEQRLQQQMQQGMGGMGGMAAQRQMQGGFGPQAPTQEAYRGFKAMTGSPVSFEEFSQSRGNKLTQQGGFGGQQFSPLDMTQDAQRQRQMQGGMGGMGGNIPGNPGFPDPRTRNQQPQFSPFQQQQNMQGIQDLFSRMMGQFQPQQPMQQMSQFRSPALGYRPNMTQANDSLSRVKPSVQKQNQDAQAARIAELEAQLAGYQTPTNDTFGGGG
jgi:hypothetical protein